jgi:arylformamidase
MGAEEGGRAVTVYDVSVPLRSSLPTYPGEPGPELSYFKRIAEGGSANVSKVSLGSHSGTHIDAPHHFIDGGATVEQLPLEPLLGPAYVVEHTGPAHVTGAGLDALGLPGDARRLLVKTSNGRLWDGDEFRQDFIAYADDAGDWLVRNGFVLAGIDYLSIERFRAPGHPVHLALLRAGVIVLEGLDLRAVPPGRYNMACAPLKVVGAEGAPARVFLWDELPD